MPFLLSRADSNNNNNNNDNTPLRDKNDILYTTDTSIARPRAARRKFGTPFSTAGDTFLPVGVGPSVFRLRPEARKQAFSWNDLFKIWRPSCQREKVRSGAIASATRGTRESDEYLFGLRWPLRGGVRMVADNGQLGLPV